MPRQKKLFPVKEKKDVFHEIMQDERADHTKPAVEWYKNDDDMLCMVKMNPSEVKMANNR